MKNKTQTLWTTGTIADKLGVHLADVAYAISRLKLEPISRAGNANIYSEDTIPAIRQFMKDKRSYSK